MNRRAAFCLTAVCLCICCAFPGMPAASETGTQQKAAQAPPSTAAEIDIADGLSDNHPEVEEGISCNDCHEITFDAKTSATQAWLYGDYLKWSAGEGVLPEGKLWEAIVRHLGRKKDKMKTFILATCLNNTPLSTTAEWGLDPEKKVLYGLHEKGTQKLLHIAKNPRVSLNWHTEFESFTDYRCIQIIGRAELIDGTRPEYDSILIDAIDYEAGAKKKKMTPEQFRESIRSYMVISKITIDQITMANYAFMKDGYRIYQRWVRNK